MDGAVDRGARREGNYRAWWSLIEAVLRQRLAEAARTPVVRSWDRRSRNREFAIRYSLFAEGKRNGRGTLPRPGCFPPSPIAHRPSPIAHRPSPIAHRPSPVARRPSPL